MLKETLNGEEITCIKLQNGKYVVIYQGETTITDFKPVTDQERETVENMRNSLSLLNYFQ
jgi:hypothetical protein